MRTANLDVSKVDRVVANLKSIGLPPDWDEGTNLLVARVYREIARGRPVNSATVDQLIKESGLALEDGREFIAGVSEKDELGNLVGSVGLSQNEYAHRFEIDGVSLTTWCAWDTLFIAQVLGRKASVMSNAPGAREHISLVIEPSGATATPDSAVVSFVMLDPEQIDMEKLESVYMVFCRQIHFFPSREAAESWSKDSEYQFEILSVEEAFEVGSKAFGKMIAAVRGSR